MRAPRGRRCRSSQLKHRHKHNHQREHRFSCSVTESRRSLHLLQSCVNIHDWLCSRDFSPRVWDQEPISTWQQIPNGAEAWLHTTHARTHARTAHAHAHTHRVKITTDELFLQFYLRECIWPTLRCIFNSCFCSLRLYSAGKRLVLVLTSNPSYFWPTPSEDETRLRISAGLRANNSNNEQQFKIIYFPK